MGMATFHTMGGGGAVCLHCGTVRINKGQQCIEVNTGRGIGYIALGCKDLHPYTKGVTPDPEPVTLPQPPAPPAK